jgi:hypothetical protein
MAYRETLLPSNSLAGATLLAVVLRAVTSLDLCNRVARGSRFIPGNSHTKELGLPAVTGWLDIGIISSLQATRSVAYPNHLVFQKSTDPVRKKALRRSWLIVLLFKGRFVPKM